MSALQVEKLEGLLARIQDRRHPRPTGVAPHPSFDSDEPITSERAAVQKAAAGAAPAAFEEERPSARASKPTPMEQALEIELESTPPPAMPAQAAAPQPAHDAHWLKAAKPLFELYVPVGHALHLLIESWPEASP